MALVKGNKLVNKPLTKKRPKRPKEDNPAFPYLSSKWLSLYWRLAPFLKGMSSFLLLMGVTTYTLFAAVIGLAVSIHGIDIFYLLGWLLSPVILYFLLKFFLKYYGRYSFLVLDGPKWMKLAQLLSPKNPSPGLKVIGTQLVTSRFLITPGPCSTYNGWFRGHSVIAVFLAVGLICFTAISPSKDKPGIDILTFMDPVLQMALAGILTIISLFYAVYTLSTGKNIFQPNRFFIFDRKTQRVSFHTGFFFRRMETYPWQEFEGRAMYGQYGNSTILVHVPTGNILEMQFHNAHWNNSGAVEAYSYVARFMDLSQALPNEEEFTRYLPDVKNVDDLTAGEYFAIMNERGKRRDKYHNPPAGVVFGNIHSFDVLIEQNPWLSAKNVWNAAHRYNREPNWDKWVRDKWGIAANEEYQVPDNEKVGEPEWFNEFYQFLKSNRSKIKYMDDDKRIKFTQDWFEETFPRLHWVDPITADKYDQEEVFS